MRNTTIPNATIATATSTSTATTTATSTTTTTTTTIIQGPGGVQGEVPLGLKSLIRSNNLTAGLIVLKVNSSCHTYRRRQEHPQTIKP